MPLLLERQRLGFWLQMVGLGMILAGGLGMSVPLFDRLIVIPPAHGRIPQLVETLMGVVMVGIADRQKGPRLLSGFKYFLHQLFMAILILLSANLLSHLVSDHTPTAPWTRQGSWTGTLDSPQFGRSDVDLLLSPAPDAPGRLDGTLRANYRNGDCVFTLHGTHASTDRADLEMSFRAGDDSCHDADRRHLRVQLMDDQSLDVVQSDQDSQPIFGGRLSRPSAPPVS